MENKDSKSLSMQKNSKSSKKGQLYEIFRFIIVGGVATIVDFLCEFVTLKLFENNLSTQGSWGGYVSFAVATVVGFAISTIVNYVFSALWVFQNVDEKAKTKSQKSVWLFTGLSAIGLLLGVGLQELGVWICKASFGLDLSLDITKVSFATLFQEGGIAFWAFVIIFCIKTAVTMVYNYITRKKLVFKAPEQAK
jgi:putative flippase GtrA